MDILIAGESWVTHSIHIKGFDTFTTSGYEEGVHWLKAALERAGHKVRFLPNHLVSREFSNHSPWSRGVSRRDVERLRQQHALAPPRHFRQI